MEQREQKQQAKMRQQQARQTLAARAGYAEKVKKGCVCVVHFNRWGTEKEKGLRLVFAFLASCFFLASGSDHKRQPRLRPPSFKQAAHIKLKHTQCPPQTQHTLGANMPDTTTALLLIPAGGPDFVFAFLLPRQESPLA